jgi:shikimate kinase
MTKNLILVGYRGTGKSTVGHELSIALRLQLVSLDEELVRRAGTSIPELVKTRGWDDFRNLEQALVAELTEGTGRILDCGGGVVERSANILALRAAGTVFWLTASPATIVDRISGGAERPALTATMSFTEEVETVLARRNPLYAEIAHVRIDTEQSSPQEVGRLIASLWPSDPRTMPSR